MRISRDSVSVTIRRGWIVAFAAIALVAAGCDSGTEDDTGTASEGTEAAAASAGIEVAGAWANDFDGSETVTDSKWSMTFVGADGSAGTSTQTIISYDNEANTAITQNAADAEFGASQFNRNVWTDAAEDGSWYYCTEVFSVVSAEEAIGAPSAADPGDMATGCGSFAWTYLHN